MTPSPETHLASADPHLALLFEPEYLPAYISEWPDTFTAVAAAIVGQQLSGRVAEAIWARLETGLGQVSAAAIAATSDETIRAAGLSRAKTAALKDLSARVLDGRLPLDDLGSLDDDAVRSQLCAVKGIGPWTAEMVLIFHLGRPDVLPVADFGIRKAMALHWKLPDLPDPASMTRVAEPWKPYRSLACRYLWRSLDAGRRPYPG